MANDIITLQASLITYMSIVFDIISLSSAPNITLAGLASLPVVVALMYTRYKTRRRNIQELEAYQKAMDQKTISLEKLIAEQDKLLQEKEWLIKEVHHRVKNNLQMVTSMLRTQCAYLDNEAAIVAVKDSLRRMQVMSLIHKKLYLTESISSVDMCDYISELVCYLYDSFNIGDQIVFKQNIAPLQFDVSQAIPVGLIINECVVNAIKYAFPYRQNGVVNIDLQSSAADQLLLQISDNGIGLRQGLDVMQHNSMGLELIRGLSRQLNGSFEMESNGGVRVTVRFTL